MRLQHACALKPPQNPKPETLKPCTLKRVTKRSTRWSPKPPKPETLKPCTLKRVKKRRTRWSPKPPKPETLKPCTLKRGKEPSGQVGAPGVGIAAKAKPRSVALPDSGYLLGSIGFTIWGSRISDVGFASDVGLKVYRN